MTRSLAFLVADSDKDAFAQAHAALMGDPATWEEVGTDGLLRLLSPHTCVNTRAVRVWALLFALHYVDQATRDRVLNRLLQTAAGVEVLMARPLVLVRGRSAEAVEAFHRVRGELPPPDQFQMAGVPVSAYEAPETGIGAALVRIARGQT